MSPNTAIELVQPLRIAMLSIHSSPIGPLGTQNTGGMSVYVRELAKWLGYCGHRVDIYTYVRSKDEAVMLHPNVRLIHLAPQGGEAVAKEQLLLKLNVVFDALETYRRDHGLVYDLIHSHYWLSGVVGAMAQARWHCPHLTMFHTLGVVKNMTASGENESDHRIAHERWLAKVADAIVVPAIRERDNLIAHYKAEPDKIREIPCGVNLDLFQPRERMAARRKIGLPLDGDVALYVGRFASLKGIEALLGAVADLKERMPRLHLLVVGGDGPLAESTLALIRLVAELKIQDRVSFAGRVDQKALPTYYSACDLLVVPSHYESFGLVALEALACGTPVVTTPVGAVETIIQPGINGDIVGQSSRDMVARGIVRVLNDRRPAPCQIRATVAHCGWERIAADVIDAYGELIKFHQTASPPKSAALCCSFPN